MVKVIFEKDNQRYDVDVPEGTTILEAAHSNSVPLEGSCEGGLACSTCHVVLEQKHYDQLPEIVEEEEDMLDMAFGLTATSRLGCQVAITNELEGAVFKIPSRSKNS